MADSHRPVYFAMLDVLMNHLPAICSNFFLFKEELSFFGALRVGELVSPSGRGIGLFGCCGLRRQVDFVQSGLLGLGLY